MKFDLKKLKFKRQIYENFSVKTGHVKFLNLHNNNGCILLMKKRKNYQLIYLNFFENF